ncbi:hypothetical protein EJM73_08355 [Clostridium botulinum]|uniref:hypothetical protein n=1 Tax=Clostridium botulinum TaxID=1491 RepID=UPI0013758555|nr:hypothetical protein [Clostridium botulinum]NCI19911.1 hypothetical protein [Clostridium botulinum]NCI35673.1 hypothetical protein [Clostridium botulinum]NCI71806.1 hypothetical protein [Clostridium botulinum]NDI38722.1 hypothetical protein [Clostridium botulinum]
MYKLGVFQCDDCGCKEYLDIEGSGVDECGNGFSDYWCKECGELTRIYDGDFEPIEDELD